MPGMLGLAPPFALQDLARAQLVGVGLVGRRGGDAEHQRVLDRRLGVVGEALVQPRHRVAVGAEAGAVLAHVVAGEDEGERLDIGGFALVARAEALRLVEQRAPLAEIGRGGLAVGIGQQAQRLAPMGHGAAGIGLARRAERLGGGLGTRRSAAAACRRRTRPAPRAGRPRGSAPAERAAAAGRPHGRARRAPGRSRRRARTGSRRERRGVRPRRGAWLCVLPAPEPVSRPVSGAAGTTLDLAPCRWKRNSSIPSETERPIPEFGVVAACSKEKPRRF